MPNARELANPKNASSGGGPKFTEGLVRVDKGEFGVFQKKGPKDGAAPAPIIALLLTVTRLDEEHRPLQAEDGQPLVEVLDFGMGTTSLTYAHPARATGPDDDDPEDVGVEVGAVGPTWTVSKSGFTVNDKTAYHAFNTSLEKAGYFKPGEEQYHWGPSYEGSIFFMTNQPEKMERNGKSEQYFVKVVSEVVKNGMDSPKPQAKSTASAKKTAPPAQAKPKAAESKPASTPAPAPSAAADAGGVDVDSALREQASEKLIEWLPKIFGGKIGEPFSPKSLGTQVGMVVTGKPGVKEVKGLSLAMVRLVKDSAWLAENGVFQHNEELIQPVFGEDGGVVFQAAE